MSTDETTVLNIRFPNTLVTRLKREAEKDYRTVGSLVRKLVASGLEGGSKKSA